MGSQFRPTAPEDAPAVAAFLRKIFDLRADHPLVDPRQMHWKYWDPYPGWSGSRAFLIEREGQITAHGAVVPLRFALGNCRLRMVHVIDWAADPASTGAGISLMQHVSQMVDGVLAAGGSEATQRILPALGFKDCGTVSRFALPLRPFRRLLAESAPSWRVAARFARNVAWRMRAPRPRLAGWRARRLLPADVAKAEFPTPRSAGQVALFERTPQQIAYLLECPVAPGELYLLERQGAVCGYFVLIFTPGQCRIGDAWVGSEREEAWNVLYALAAAKAMEHPDIAEIATVSSTEAEMRSLQQSGFHDRGSLPLRLRIRNGTPPPNLRYQLADSDEAYLHWEQPAFWA